MISSQSYLAFISNRFGVPTRSIIALALLNLTLNSVTLVGQRADADQAVPALKLGASVLTTPTATQAGSPRTDTPMMIFLPGSTNGRDTPIIAPACLVPTVGAVNPKAELIALAHTDRGPRRFAKLLPGKIYRWQYQWILEDGNTVTQMLPYQVKCVRDDRPIVESHPNLYYAFLAGSFIAGPASTVAAGWAAH